LLRRQTFFDGPTVSYDDGEPPPKDGWNTRHAFTWPFGSDTVVGRRRQNLGVGFWCLRINLNRSSLDAVVFGNVCYLDVPGSKAIAAVATVTHW